MTSHVPVVAPSEEYFSVTFQDTITRSAPSSAPSHPTPTPERTDAGYAAQIRAAAEHVRALSEEQAVAYRQRNELIAAAVAAGLPQRAAARAAGLTQTRIIALLDLADDGR